jgi:F0F1-type ATP synthase assembly protein I
MATEQFILGFTLFLSGDLVGGILVGIQIMKIVKKLKSE